MGLFSNAMLAPERGDGNRNQEEKFELDDLLGTYVEFEFQGGDTENVSAMMDLEFKVSHLSSFSKEVLEIADMQANNFIDGTDGRVTVKEGPEDELTVQVLDENGNSLGNVKIDVWINESLAETLLPNGDRVEDMRNYGWKEFKELEGMARDYEASKDFAKAIGDIPENNDNLAR